jgi:hypothetical protein
MIKAYHLNRLYVCEITGETVIEVEYAGKIGLQAYQKHLSTKDTALAYVDKEARDWFFGVLEDYVNHKRHIIEAGKHENQLKPLQICKEALSGFEKLATNKCCHHFLRGFDHFKAILPSPNNPSYEGSCLALEEMKKFCTEFLKFKPLAS